MSNPDDDPAFDIDPDGDAAAYDEWAALAGEPARAPPDHPQCDFADGRASFDSPLLGNAERSHQPNPVSVVRPSATRFACVATL
jgi:hypothetical protein